MAKRALSGLLALACDTLLPELPNQVHPVVWMGKWIKRGEQFAPSNEAARLVWGAVWLSVGMGLSAGLAARIPKHPLVQALVAQSLLAYRALDRAVGEVQTALAANDLAEARRLLSWHLVSRDTTALNSSEVAAAAIESLAENLSDSVIAPLFWYLAAGLPGLAAYRMSNTFDAMWGYRNQRFEYLGKVAARCDDALNLIPARLTAGMLWLVAQGQRQRTWQVAWRDHGNTASPNAGWPMAAMAGALDTQLVKIDHYQLGNGLVQPDPALMQQARQLTRHVIYLVVAGLVVESIKEHRTKSIEHRELGAETKNY